jgi:hypothetical protein
MDGGIISGPLLISLLGAVAGPLLAQVPQLLGVLADKPFDFLATLLRAEAENGLQREAGQQALMRDLLAETNRSLLMDQLIERLGQGGEGGGAAALLPLLAGAQSLGAAPGAHEARSVRLVFEAGPLVDVGGKLKSVFAQGGAGIDLRITLQLIENAPKSPLPRAIAALVVTDPATGRRLLEKSFRLTDLELCCKLGMGFPEAAPANEPKKQRTKRTRRNKVVVSRVRERLIEPLYPTDDPPPLQRRPRNFGESDEDYAARSTFLLKADCLACHWSLHSRLDSSERCNVCLELYGEGQPDHAHLRTLFESNGQGGDTGQRAEVRSRWYESEVILKLYHKIDK